MTTPPAPTTASETPETDALATWCGMSEMSRHAYDLEKRLNAANATIAEKDREIERLQGELNFVSDPAATFEVESKCAEKLSQNGQAMVITFDGADWFHYNSVDWANDRIINPGYPTRGESACAFARKLFTSTKEG